jgi:hypothetical protein
MTAAAGTTEFSRGGRGGSYPAAEEGQPGVNYGDGGSGVNSGKNAAGKNGHAGIVIVRFKRAEELHVFFNLGKFEPLMLADVKTPALTNTTGETLKLTLAADPAVCLWPRYITGYFSPVVLSQDTSGADSIPEPEGHTYTIKVVNQMLKTKYAMLGFTNDSENGVYLPHRDVDALLEFELKYQPFGAEASGGRVWLIKNGLYNAPDDGGGSAGSYIPVKFGAGAPPDIKGEGTIIYAK